MSNPKVELHIAGHGVVTDELLRRSAGFVDGPFAIAEHFSTRPISRQKL